VLRLAEDERERVEHERRPEPDVLAPLGLDARTELAERADDAVHAVRADDEVGVGGRLDLDPELEVRADRERAPLEDLEQPRPPDRGERVPARAEDAAAVADVDAVPARERVRDLEPRLVIRLAERAQGLLGEDDAPPEGRVGRISLDDTDVRGRIRLPEQDREVEPGRSAADDLDLQREITSASRSRSSRSETVG
jgi:hypothetical protein